MRLSGRVEVPGDKSISHRALLLSSLAREESVLRGLNRGGDCAHTLANLRALGVSIEQEGESWIVFGRGLELQKPQGILNCGNSATTLRLLAGILAGQEFLSILDGSSSLRSRPMARVVEPLRLMGADLFGPGGSNFAPLSMRGGSLKGIRYELPVPSAQVKSAVLLAGLQAEGTTTIIEPVACGDDMEKMLLSVGADLKIEGIEIHITGANSLQGRYYDIPGDVSAAAFLLGGAAALPGSEIIVENIGLNPTRLGFFEILEAMGVPVEIIDKHNDRGELVGTVLVRSGKLTATTIGGDIIPRLLDEIPILAILATQAEGTTVIKDAGELRVKESDRLANLAQELNRIGACVKETPTGLEITGPTKLTGGTVQSHGDHRLALAFEVAGLFCSSTLHIQGHELSKGSFPGFQQTWKELIKVG